MARGEGAWCDVRHQGGGLQGTARYQIFHRPLEEDLQWIPCRTGQGQRAVYQGNIPVHIGERWDWVSWGDAGMKGGTAYPAIVTGWGNGEAKTWSLPGKTVQEAEAHHVVVQTKQAWRDKEPKATVGGDSKVAESMFVAAAVGGGSRIWSREMSQYTAVMEGTLEDEAQAHRVADKAADPHAAHHKEQPPPTGHGHHGG